MKQRLTFDQSQNWRRAVRLGGRQCYGSFASLRALWHSCQNGDQYGLYSGYAS